MVWIICRVLYIPGGVKFLPSTVVGLEFLLKVPPVLIRSDERKHTNKWHQRMRQVLKLKGLSWYKDLSSPRKSTHIHTFDLRKNIWWMCFPVKWAIVLLLVFHVKQNTNCFELEIHLMKQNHSSTGLIPDSPWGCVVSVEGEALAEHGSGMARHFEVGWFFGWLMGWLGMLGVQC